ncbi:hypothetical protein T08_1242 [Trichinella sp. T8]|nr:hypothetical protein T08_1242 [Trichinella sp. T8]
MPTAAVELWHTCRQAENVEKKEWKKRQKKNDTAQYEQTVEYDMTLPTHKSREWQRGDKHF